MLFYRPLLTDLEIDATWLPIYKEDLTGGIGENGGSAGDESLMRRLQAVSD